MGKTFKDLRNKYRKGDPKKSTSLKKKFKANKNSPKPEYDDWNPKNI